MLLIGASSLKTKLKTVAAVLVGLGGLYPLSWFSMFLLSPSIGRDLAHEHIVTEMFTFIGVGSLLLGLAILSANLFFNLFRDV